MQFASNFRFIRQYWLAIFSFFSNFSNILSQFALLTLKTKNMQIFIKREKKFLDFCWNKKKAANDELLYCVNIFIHFLVWCLNLEWTKNSLIFLAACATCIWVSIIFLLLQIMPLPNYLLLVPISCLFQLHIFPFTDSISSLLPFRNKIAADTQRIP